MADFKMLELLSMDEVKDIKDKVNSKLLEYKKVNRIIKEDIFKILEMNCRVIYYPIKDDEICGFVYKYKDKKFVYINSYIPLEKQVFVAAHELYHIWHSDIKKGELLKRIILEETATVEEINKEELAANRFGAEFLIAEDVFENELKIRNIQRNYVNLKQIVELMDVFLVPYKTLVRRLYEINYISMDQCRELLTVEDRKENEGIMLWQKRLNICKRNNERTEERKLDKLIDMALELYEKKQITYEKLEYLLRLSQVTPADFNIYEEKISTPSEEEILKILEEE